MFDEKSRYAKIETYTVKDHRGRDVLVVPVAPGPQQSFWGIHRLRQGERLDHLAARYLGDPTAYWRIAGYNDVMLPESLREAREIDIPQRKG